MKILCMFGLNSLLLGSMGAGDDKISLLRSSNSSPGFQDRKYANTPLSEKRMSCMHLITYRMQIYLNILHIYLFIGFALYGLNKVGAMGDGLGMGNLTGNSTWGTNDGVTYAELDTIQVSPLTHKKET